MSAASSSTPPAVLMVANFSNRTGYAWNNIYRLFELLARRFGERGWNACVSFAEYDPPLDWKSAELFLDVLELDPSPSSARALGKWYRTIRHHRVKVIYLTDQPSWSWRYLLARAAGVRKIIVHNRVSVADPFPARPETGWRGLLKWLGARQPFVGATRTYAVSDFVRNRLVRKARIREDRVVTIINGVDLDRFRPRPSHSDRQRLTIFCGGRATVYKGIRELILATAMLRDNHGLDDFTVRYAGDGPDIESFRLLAEELGILSNFEFLGELPSTDDELADADIVVVPSIWGDACPSAISEALASGKPLVATKVGGVPELIGDDAAAIMVEPNDSDALAAALARLLVSASERESFSENARRRAEYALDERRYYEEVLGQMSQDVGIDLARSGAII